MPRPKGSSFNNKRVVSSAPRPRKPCDYTWLRRSGQFDAEELGEVTDRAGATYHIQECCGVWDRGVGFHSPKCANATKFVGTGRSDN